MTASDLTDQIDDYLALRRSLGFKLRTDGWLLADFARYADRVGHHGPVTADLAVRWATNTERDAVYAARRLETIRGFTRHQAVFDPRTEIPPVGLLGPATRPRSSPHIYTDVEIADLLDRCRQVLLPRQGLRPVTYVAVFSLLAATGLRLSEVCHLTRDDVDLSHGMLTVRETKFRKSRLVALHPTATEALVDYANDRDHRLGGGPTGGFFRTDRAQVLLADTVGKTFARLRASLGWTAEGRARRPRIHDLRHTFAVRRLLAWAAEGVDIDRNILALSTYLGHTKPSDTYWYLTAVPELMAITSRRFADHAEPAMSGGGRP